MSFLTIEVSLTKFTRLLNSIRTLVVKPACILVLLLSSIVSSSTVSAWDNESEHDNNSLTTFDLEGYMEFNMLGGGFSFFGGLVLP